MCFVAQFQHTKDRIPSPGGLGPRASLMLVDVEPAYVSSVSVHFDSWIPSSVAAQRFGRESGMLEFALAGRWVQKRRLHPWALRDQSRREVGALPMQARQSVKGRSVRVRQPAVGLVLEWVRSQEPKE